MGVFPYKVFGRLFVFHTEEAQKLLSCVVVAPHSMIIETDGSIFVKCLQTYTTSLIVKRFDACMINGYISQDAKTLYDALTFVNRKHLEGF